MTTERITHAFAMIAFPNLGDYVRLVDLKNGTRRVVGKSPDELTPEQAFAVKSWTVVEHEGKAGTILDYQYILHDRVKALLALAKHMGLFNEQLQIQIRNERTSQHDVDLSSVPYQVLQEAVQMLEGVRRKVYLSAGPQHQ